MANADNITDARAARRFHQIRALEKQLQETNGAISDAKTNLKELQEEAEGLMKQIRVAARDEGALPLFDAAGLGD